MKFNNENNESSYIQYCDVGNLYGQLVLQKLPVNNFQWIKDTFQFNENSIKNYNEEIDEGYFLEDDVEHLEKLNKIHNDLPFSPEKIEIEKFQKFLANLHDKIDHVIHIRSSKQALNHRLVHRMTEFNQNACPKH